MKTTSFEKKHLRLSIVLILIVTNLTLAQTSEFTYQGKLDVAGTTSATYDFEFQLCDTVDCDSVLDSNLRPGVTVSGGVFSVKLDFGAEFTGRDRFLEIRIKRAGETVYTPLLPRQKITSAPYLIQAATATNALKLGGTLANQYVLTTDSRLNAGNYMQNTTALQPTVSFNIGGTGTANVFTATSGFNIGVDRVLSISGSSNTVVGRFAGGANTSGNTNTFVGDNAGRLNATGFQNTFVGSGSALFHTTGSYNLFAGSLAGANNTTGNYNVFLGDFAVANNQIGSNNIFIGASAGNPNTSTQVNNSVAIGSNVTVSTSNTIVF